MTNTAPSFGSPTTLDGHSTYTVGDPAVILDADVQIHDAEFDTAGSYDGATLTLERNGGQNPDDVFTYFSFSTPAGSILFASSVSVATVAENSGGRLVLTFNANATQELVSQLMHSITYANTGPTGGPVQIDWTFADNDTAEPLTTTGSTTVDVTIPAVDLLPPIVASIVADQPAITTAHTINYTVTFSEAVTNVDVFDFGLSYDGTMSGLSITDAVSASGNAFDTTWIVTVDAGLDPGWVQLIVSSADVVDFAGNYLALPWGLMTTIASYDGRAPDDFTGPFYVTTGDVNGDGYVDVVTSNPNDNRVAVLLGDGFGNFTQDAIYDIDGAPLGQGQAYGINTGAPYAIPQDLTLADLDGDGDLDMAVTVLEFFNGLDFDSHSGIAIRWNDGSGNFGGSGGFDYYEGVGEGPRRVVAGDFNDDGSVDLAVSNSYDGTVSIMISDGAGGFVGGSGTFPIHSVGTGGVLDIKLGDADNDGFLDIIGTGGTSAFALTGNGDGTFDPAIESASFTTGFTRSLDVGDIDGDGNLDAVVVNDIANDVTVLLGNGDGTFTAGDTYAVGDRPFSVALGDIDGDGRLDIAVANRFDDTITVLHGIGDGTFVLQGDASNSTPALPAGSYPTDVAMADINQDGAVDLIVPGYHTPVIYALMGGHVNYVSPVVTITDNTPPVAVGDTVTTDEDTAVIIDVLANDSDTEDGAPLPGTVTNAYGAAHGSLTINGDGTITYTPDADYNGADSFTYEVTDSLGATATATVDVTINPINDPPGATLEGAALEDVPSPLQLVGTDVDGTVTGFRIVTAPGHGTLTYTDGTGTHAVTSGMVIAAPSTILDLTYTSDADFNGLDSVVVSAIDDQGLEAPPVTHTIQVLPVNDAPSVADFQQFSGDEDVALTASIAASDIDSATLAYTLVTGTAHGALTFNGNGTFTYLPDTDYSGFDGFTYTVDDGDGGEVTRTAEFTINPVNDAPGATLEGAALEDVPSPLQLVGIDVDGTVTGFRIVTAPGHGTLTYTDGTGTHAVTSGMVIAAPSTILDLTYTSDTDFNGLDSVVVSAIDDQGLEAPPVTHTIQVLPVNDAPVFEPIGSALDIVLTNWAFGGDDITVALGKGDGTTDSATIFSGGSSDPYAVVLGDVNGDGNLDVVTSHYFGLDVTLGNGDGTLAPTSVVATGGAFHNKVVLGDLNGDGNLDIVASDYYGAFVTLGNGDGTFGAGTTVSTGGTGNTSVSLGDVDGDGDLDIVTVEEFGQAHVALGNGDGTFAAGAAIGHVGTYHYSVALGDVDNDGNLDIVTVEEFGDAYVALGNGDGTFAAGVAVVPVGAFNAAFTVVLGDVNGDGNLDIVASEYGNGATVALGNGDGTFAAGTLIVTGGNKHYTVALGDLNADGKLDIVVDNSDGTSNGALVVLGNGNGTFGSGIGAASYFAYPFYNYIHSIALGDLNPAPAIQDSAGLSEDAASVSGVLGFSDVDTADVHTVAPAGTYTGSGTALGTLTASLVTDTTGSGTGGRIAWTYTLDSAAAQYLGEGETKFETFEVSLSDGTGTHTKTVTVTIEGSNDAPVLSAGSAPLPYTENDPPTAAAPSLDITDVDSATLFGAVVTISAGFAAGEDSLVVTPLGGISASYDAGTGTLTLLGEASQADYQATLRSVAYVNGSENPSTATRTISFQVDDGQLLHNLSNVADVTVDVTAVNDVPVINEGLESFVFAENTINAAVRLAGPTGSIVTDVDSADFAGGQIAFRWAEPTGAGDSFGPMAAGHRTENVLSIRDAGLLTFDGSNVSFNGIVVGTVASPSENGQAGNDLVIDLNASATAARVNAIIRNLTYQNTSDTPQASRLLTVQVSDGDGGTSTLDSGFVTGNTTGVWQINVTPQNDPLSGQVHIADIPIIGASSAQLVIDNTITDPDLMPGDVVETHWQKWTGATWVDIGIGPALTVDTAAVPSLKNALLRAVAHYSDGFGSYDIAAEERAKIGSATADTLVGTLATDLLAGLDGNDTYTVGADDRIYERAGGGTDLVQSATISLDLQSGAYANVENAKLLGMADGLDLWGNGDSNRLTGNAGDNRIDGRGGADIMAGGAGNDTYVVDDMTSARAGGTGDLVSEKAGEGTDTVEAGVSYTLRANVENLVLTGVAAIDGTGNSAANEITGNDAGNVLSGRQGNDVLTGGGGGDHFVFDTAFAKVANIDQITDFETGIDKISLLLTLFTGTGLVGGTMSEAAFHIGAAATGGSHRIIYNDETGALSYDRDGSGTRAAVQFAQLDPHLALTYQDFVII